MPELNEPDYPEVRGPLEALASAMAREEAPEHVEARLLESFRQRRKGRSRRGWVWIGAGIASIAAALLVIALLPLRREAEPVPVRETAGAVPRNAVPPRPAPPAPEVTPRPRPKTAARGPRKAAPVQRTAARPEVASDFFPLRPGPVVDAGEFASLVRVSLPRSEMRRFGLMTGFETLESVQADVVVGQDGMARAVRFVSTGRR